MMTHKGFTIQTAKPTGGKAGTGRNKTSTVQVKFGNCIEKQIRFTVGDDESLRRATLKALEYANNPPEKKR